MLLMSPDICPGNQVMFKLLSAIQFLEFSVERVPEYRNFPCILRIFSTEFEPKLGVRNTHGSKRIIFFF